ncbi:MAG: 3-hydroxypropionyl-coenzyme A dehydratase [Promethearchaeota archaeon]|nr:MAG: 3-hydroxypropionyl-coenzyme A dehydratase [Candidatus Lokiarchaeota archaeon]
MDLKFMKKNNQYEHVKLDLPQSSGGSIDANYAVISLNRPEKLNAITLKTLREIVDALESMELDSNIGCVVLRGTKDYTKKPAFSTGADLSNPFEPGIKPSIPIHMTYAITLFHNCFDRIESFAKPLIAAVDGYALGGGFELSLACDILIASERSIFGFAEILRGIFPSGGGTQRAVRNLGFSRSIKMLYFGERVSAKELYKNGYVSFLAKEGDEFEKMLHDKACMLGNSATTALSIIKKCLKFGTEVSIPIGLQFEQLGFGVNSAAEDVQEGIKAFLRKKEPKYQGY